MLSKAKVIVETLLLMVKTPQANPAVSPIPGDSLSIPGSLTSILIVHCLLHCNEHVDQLNSQVSEENGQREEAASEMYILA